MQTLSRRYLTPLHLGLVLLVVSLVSATPLYAQSENEEQTLTATLTLGFDSGQPARRIDTWTPLNALLENRGDAIRGRLVAQVYYGLEATDIIYSCPVDLPTGSRKMYRVPVFLSGEAAEAQVSVEYGRKRVVLGQLATLAFDEQSELLGALTRERDRLNFLATRLEEADEEQTIRRILYMDTQTLPTEWIAYQGLDALIWDGGQAETALLPEQLSAFRSWLTMGGRLILFVGAMRQELTETAWAQFLPLELTSTETLPAGTILEGPLFREPQNLSRPVVVSAGPLHETLQPRVLLHAGEIPIVVEADWGAGTVVYCAFEPQPAILTSMGATVHLWDVLLTGLGSLPVSITNQLDPLVSRFLRSLVQAELPSAWFIAGFLGLYILLIVPVNYLVFRRFRRLEWAWLMVPVWAVVFTVAAYHISAIHQRGTVDLNALSIIETFPDSTRGRATSFVSIYSPIRHWYDVRFPGGGIYPHLVAEDEVFASGLSTASAQNLAVYYDPDTTIIADILIHHWSQRMVKAAHAVDLGKGVAIDLAWDETRLRGTVTNRTPYTILNPTLYILDRQYELGQRLQPNQENSVPESYQKFDLREVGDQLAEQGLLAPYYSRRRRSSRIHEEEQFGLVYRWWLHYEPFARDFSLLTGWIEHLFLEPKLDRSINQQQGQALLAVLFSTYSWPSGITRIPPSSWHMQSPFATGLPPLLPRRTDMIPLQSGQPLEYTLMTDFTLRGAQIHRLKIDPSDTLVQQMQNRRDIRPIIALQNWQTKEWKEIPWRISDSSGRGRIVVETEDVTDPNLYVKLRSGTIGIRIENPGPSPMQIDENSLSIALDVEYGG